MTGLMAITRSGPLDGVTVAPPVPLVARQGRCEVYDEVDASVLARDDYDRAARLGAAQRAPASRWWT